MCFIRRDVFGVRKREGETREDEEKGLIIRLMYEGKVNSSVDSSLFDIVRLPSIFHVNRKFLNILKNEF